MRITVIKGDKTIGINNIFFRECDLSFLADNIHAIQIDGDYKEAEYTDQNNDDNIDQSTIDQIIAEYDRRKAEEEAKEEAERLEQERIEFEQEQLANFLKQDDSGNWVQDIDRKWENVRAERDGKLASCDWTQAKDSPLSGDKQTEWATYRQSLRGITEQSDPFNIVWPEPPL